MKFKKIKVVMSILAIAILVFSTLNGASVANGEHMPSQDVDYVVIVPEEDQTIEAGEEFLFDAEAYDEEDDLITDEPDDFEWENALNGVFYEEDTGEYEVTATFEETSSVTVTVTVVPADTDYIVVEPDDSTIEAGGSEIYTVEAYDRYHNEIGDVTGDVEWSDDIPEEGQDWDANEITVYEAGTWEITAEYENEVVLTDTVELNVEPGDVFSVVIEPNEDQTVEAGEPLVFDAWAYDEYNNTITDDVGDFEWKNAEQSVFVETVVGDYNVTATYEGTESPVTVVTVEAGDVDYIVAEDVTEMEGEDGEIVVTAYDEFDNEVEGETISVDDDDDLGGITIGDTEVTNVNGVATFSFNEETAGEYVVEFSAEDETITDNATVTIVDYYIVAEDVTETAGEDGEIVVTAYDQDDNPMEGEMISVDDDDDLDGITIGDTEITDVDGVATFSFNEETAGEYVVEFAAENEAVRDTAAVTIEVGDVDHIVAEDVTETAGEDGEIVVTAYDGFGNEVEGEEISVIDDDGLGGITTGDTEVTDVDGVVIFTFNEETAGEYVVEFSAEDEEVTDTATVTIEAGEVDHIVAEDVTETAGEDGEIVVTAYDGFDNEVEGETISVDDDGGLGGITIGDTEVTDVEGVAIFTFNEIEAGEYVVGFSAEDETITDTATVTIEAEEVDHIVAEDVTETAGEDGEIVVTAYDQDDNPMEGEIISVIDDDGLGGIDVEDTEVTDVDGVATFTFNEETAGEYVVEFSAEDETITDTATVTIEAGDVDHIVVEDVTETAGEDGEILVTAYDGFDNEVEGETISVDDDGGLDGITIGDTEVTDVDGVAIFMFNEETVGEYVVEFSAEDEEITDTATVTIEAREVDHIVAEDVTETAGEDGEIAVTAYDQDDNPMEGETISVIDDDDLGGITTGDTEVTDVDGVATFTFNEETAGEYVVEFSAEDETITDTATVTIEAREFELMIHAVEGGTTDPEPGTHTYEEGEEVTVEAFSDEGWLFVEWTGDYEGTEEVITIEMDSDKEITAWFEEEMEYYELTVNIEGEGEVVVDPEQEEYAEGTEVTLTAAADEGWYFVEWTEDFEGTEEEITMVMDSDMDITAIFEEEIEYYELTVNIEGEGTVDVDPEHDQYEEGTEVTLTAEPDEGWLFVEWSGDFEGTEEEITIVMDSDMDITAIFEEEIEYYELTVNIEGEGTVDVDPEHDQYEEGTEVTLTAEPDEGWLFVEWSGDVSEDLREEDEITITMDEDKEITAHFEEEDEAYLLWLLILLIIIVLIILLLLLYWRRSAKVSVMAPEDQTETEPGTTYTYDFTVKNESKDEDTFELKIEASNENWDVMAPEEISIEKESEEKIPVEVFIPEFTEDGEFTMVKLTAISQRDKDVSDFDENIIAFEALEDDERWLGEQEGEVLEDDELEDDELEDDELEDDELEDDELEDDELEDDELEDDELEDDVAEDDVFVDDEFQDVEATKDEIIEDFSRVSGIGTHTADILYEHGYRSIEELKQASKEEIQEIKGIGPALSEKIKESLEDIQE